MSREKSINQQSKRYQEETLSSNFTVEHFFSALRRLEVYLHSTMSQGRMNHIAILNCYQEEDKKLDFIGLINEFIQKKLFPNKYLCTV